MIPRLPNHRTVPVTDRWGVVRIDEKIAPLVKAMWDAGIETMQSCQDQEGWAVVQLRDERDALGLLALMPTDGRRNRPILERQYGLPAFHDDKNRWRWCAEADMWDDGWHLSITVHIPVGQVPRVTKWIQDCLAPTTSSTFPTTATDGALRYCNL